MYSSINLKGYTLMEIIVTIIIIGTLGAIALPNYQKTLNRAKVDEAKQILAVYYAAAKNYCIQNDVPYTDINQLDVSVTPKYFNAPAIPDENPQVNCNDNNENLVMLRFKDVWGWFTIREDGSFKCYGIGCRYFGYKAGDTF